MENKEAWTLRSPHKSEISPAIYYLEQNVHYTFIAYYIYSAVQNTVNKVSPSIFLSLQTGHPLGFVTSPLCGLLQSLYRKELLAP